MTLFIDNRLPLSYYYRIANEIVKEANVHSENGDSEGLRQALCRYSRIVSEIRLHPSYYGYSNEILHHTKVGIDLWSCRTRYTFPTVQILQQFSKELENLNSRITGENDNISCSTGCYNQSESNCYKDIYQQVSETIEHRTRSYTDTHINNEEQLPSTDTMSNHTTLQATSINRHFDIIVNSVKHYFPSPALSCVEAPPVTGHVSRVTFPEPNIMDVKSREESSTSKSRKGLHISAGLMDEFMELAKANTMKDLETCGILGASLKNDIYYITTLIMPKQESTANSCQALNEEEIHAILEGESLYPAGWIHTHPSQTCFLSSIDLHTQYSYQVMLPEAVAVVMAPTDSERKSGIFRISDPGGIDVLRQCQERGFHSHPETADGSPIYEICSDVHIDPNLRFEIFEMRLRSSD